MLDKLLVLSGLILAIVYLVVEWWETVLVELIRNEEETGLGPKEQWSQWLAQH